MSPTLPKQPPRPLLSLHDVSVGRYFMMCPSRFGLSANTSVVLLEAEPAHGFAQYLGPKVHGPPESFVSSKVAAYKSWARLVRRFAPNAWLGYVGWPGWGRALSLDGLAAEAAFFSQVEEHLAAATFALPVLIAASQRNQTRWYADGMHPNQDGHALLGELAASLVMSSWPSRPGRSCAGTKGSALGNNVIPSSEHSHDVCALDACDMPVTLSRDFDLRDEGGTKGVKKFGYVSTVPGGFLTLGPLVPELNCALFEASVGYLSSWHPNMGAFDVSCSGCECKPLAGAWANALKFPRVTTWTSSDPKDATNSLNASLTLFNKFLLYKTPAPCFINVTHAHRDYQRAGPSRIRIDSLSLQLAGCSVSCELTKRPWTKDFGVRTRSTCWSGANRGLASYLVPSCFNHSIRCTDPKVTGHPEYT